MDYSANLPTSHSDAALRLLVTDNTPAPIQATAHPMATTATATATATATDSGDEHCTNDYIKVPGMLDKSFKTLGSDLQLRPTIISPATGVWIKKSQRALSSDPVASSVDSDKQVEERKQAFELLDALTKSGSIRIDDCSLHVVMASTHCFDQSLLDTVIQCGENPIERLEQSLLVMASVIHDKFNFV